MAKENYIFGIHPVIEAIKAGKEIDKVLIQSDLRNAQITSLRRLIKDYSISSQNIPQAKLNHGYKKNHQGVVALLSPIEFQPYQELLAKTYEAGKVPLFLILDRISDVGNFGAICRTAECCGVNGIIIPVKNSAQINGETIKRSSGALLNVSISRERDLAKVMEDLQQSGLQVVACTEKGEHDYFECDFKKPTAIVMGSEEDGVNSHLFKGSDERLKIPIVGKTESLNVSVATGVILYEVIRQRR